MAHGTASPFALRFVGGLAYAAALLMAFSLLFVLIGDPSAFTEEAGYAPVDVGTVLFSLVWAALLAIPVWAVRWVAVAPPVRLLLALFAISGALSQLGMILSGYFTEAEQAAAVLVTTALPLVHLLISVGLGYVVWTRREGLQGLAPELAISLVAYAGLSAVSVGLPGIATPLSGVALVVIYSAVGMILRRAAAQHG